MVNSWIDGGTCERIAMIDDPGWIRGARFGGSQGVPTNEYVTQRDLSAMQDERFKGLKAVVAWVNLLVSKAVS